MSIPLSYNVTMFYFLCLFTRKKRLPFYQQSLRKVFFLLFFCIHLPQTVDQLLTDLQLALSVCFDDDVGCGLVFFTALAHQICDKRNGFVVLNQRSVVAVFDTV